MVAGRTRVEIGVHQSRMKTVLVLLTLLAPICLSGCAAMQKGSYDPDKPAKVCPSTSEGGQTKTFCY